MPRCRHSAFSLLAIAAMLVATSAAHAQFAGTDAHNVRNSGATGAGAPRDDGQALRAAPQPAFLPDGTYFTNSSLAALPGGRWYAGDGNGRLASLENGKIRLQAGDFAHIAAPPAYTGSESYIFTAFDGDFSRVLRTAEVYITGADTLGRPATGYRYTPGASAFYSYVHNISGWNQAIAGNEGRTGATAFRTRVVNAGQGDLMAYNFSAFVTGTRPGATSFLANPAIGGLGGDLTAGTDGVYLNPYETIASDAGHDVSHVGIVINSERSNGTGALGTIWEGFKSQSGGKTAIDAHFQGSGPAGIGLDLVGTALRDRTGADTHAAITIAAGQAIFGNASNANPTRFSRYTAPGTEWLDFDPTTGWRLVVAGAPALTANTTGVTVAALRVSKPAVPANAHAPCQPGQIAWDAGYVYVCVAANGWKRAALAEW